MQPPKKDDKKELKYTCVAAQPHSSILAVGLSDGSLQLIDCAQGKVIQTTRKYFAIKI
jgi:hypothetical protein